ncbi:hypothetical protein RB614_33095 [Phytohabitans sp. ZYX-F-186]|uniref:Uncharacterized protein n=1 Tax=Phytohabitans maris TaxID=3071409 RepID=A0ABU0ZQT7_9ACTN|nr:hypothetical protein [Phytohabitans sp. ZYX-F-186]MDQ7909370.1 hypothetical protein [Phytohabitans sp. ZYX-F-186]
MADETRIDPDGLYRIFNNVDGVGDDVQGALDRVTGIRTTVPAPWGDDEHGEKFSTKNELQATDVLDGTGAQVTFIRDLTGQGRGAVDGFVSLDGDNSHGLAP